MSIVDTFARYVENKVTDLGTQALMGIVGASPLGAALSAANRFADFVDFAGQNELQALAQAGIRPLKFKYSGPELLKKADQAFMNPLPPPRSRRQAEWKRSPWAGSEEEFQSEAWKHDWRSQPRLPAGTEAGGEWTTGRLSYPVVNAPRVGRGRARTSRQRRRVNRYRRFGRKAAKGIVSSWGDT